MRGVVDRDARRVELAPTPAASAPRHAVLAAGGALASFGPLRGRLTVASSHIVLTEPVPDVLEELGWTGGEAITDARCSCTTSARPPTAGSRSAGRAAR